MICDIHLQSTPFFATAVESSFFSQGPRALSPTPGKTVNSQQRIYFFSHQHKTRNGNDQHIIPYKYQCLFHDFLCETPDESCSMQLPRSFLAPRLNPLAFPTPKAVATGKIRLDVTLFNLYENLFNHFQKKQKTIYDRLRIYDYDLSMTIYDYL